MRRCTWWVVSIPVAVRRSIAAAFDTWARGEPPTTHVVKPQSKRTVHLVDRPGAVQSTIYLGNPVNPPNDPDYLPLLVTKTLLGGYFSSRITSNIREETAVTGPSLKEIFCEIDRLQESPPTQDELRAGQNLMAGTFVLQNCPGQESAISWRSSTCTGVLAISRLGRRSAPSRPPEGRRPEQRRSAQHSVIV